MCPDVGFCCTVKSVSMVTDVNNSSLNSWTIVLFFPQFDLE